MNSDEIDMTRGGRQPAARRVQSNNGSVPCGRSSARYKNFGKGVDVLADRRTGRVLREAVDLPSD